MSRIILICLYLIVTITLIDGIKICPTLSDYNWWFFPNPQCYDEPISTRNIVSVQFFSGSSILIWNNSDSGLYTEEILIAIFVRKKFKNSKI